MWPRTWQITRRQSYSLSKAGVYLSYFSCPAWWTKSISHEKCTLNTDWKCVLGKREGEDLIQGGRKIFGGGSLWQLEAAVWGTKSCEMHTWLGWVKMLQQFRTKVIQGMGTRASQLVILMELPLQVHWQELVQLTKFFSRSWGTWNQRECCRAVAWLAFTVGNLGCVADHLVCFGRSREGMGHVSISCHQPGLWQQTSMWGL